MARTPKYQEAMEKYPVKLPPTVYKAVQTVAAEKGSTLADELRELIRDGVQHRLAKEAGRR